jgi:hypothetical protein
LKSKFETGDKPVGQDFVDLIDTLSETTPATEIKTAPSIAGEVVLYLSLD